MAKPRKEPKKSGSATTENPMEALNELTKRVEELEAMLGANRLEAIESKLGKGSEAPATNKVTRAAAEEEIRGIINKVLHEIQDANPLARIFK